MKTPKTKRKSATRADSVQRRVMPVSEERILQVCNDIAEDMNMRTHTKRELWACVRYWNDAYSKLNSRRVIQLMAVATKALRSANINDEPEPEGHNVCMSEGADK
jgi:hypothetical protein